MRVMRAATDWALSPAAFTSEYERSTVGVLPTPAWTSKRVPMARPERNGVRSTNVTPAASASACIASMKARLSTMPVA